MATISGYYLNVHVDQFDGSYRAGENCTPASVANGVRAVTGGHHNPTGSSIRALVPRSQETDPSNPGWSIPDADRAVSRLGYPVGFENHSGRGWTSLAQSHKSGLYVVAQGDSDRFSNATCSGSFNGLHCIGVHPATRSLDVGGEVWWIDDPICGSGRWERATVIKAYVQKLSYSGHFGVFTTRVPRTSQAYWGNDVPRAIRALNPSGWSMAQALDLIAKRTGHSPGYGSVINMVDLDTAFKRLHHGYGSVINPSDVTWLFNWWKAHK